MSDPYPYFKETDTPVFPGEMPYPEPVGISDPGISSLKANADHSHADNVDSGTIIQEKLISYQGPTLNGNQTGAYQWIANLGVINMTKKYPGTVFLWHYGYTMTTIGGPGSTLYTAVSPSNMVTDLIGVGQFYFNTISQRTTVTGAGSTSGRASGLYTIGVWVAGNNCPVATYADDSWWFIAKEAWP